MFDPKNGAWVICSRKGQSFGRIYRLAALSSPHEASSSYYLHSFSGHRDTGKASGDERSNSGAVSGPVKKLRYSSRSARNRS